MKKKLVRIGLASLGVALLAQLAEPALPANTAVTTAAAPKSYSYTFASSPDFINADNADVSDTPFWQPGDPNSINAAYNAGFKVVLDDLKSQLGGKGNDVLVAGDLVQGMWGRDDANTGIFGPVDTDRNRVKALRMAAFQYYSEYQTRFSSRGLDLYAAVGDHDIGDNPWGRYANNWYARFKYQHVADFKGAWAKRFTANGTRFASHPTGTPYDETAYAFRPIPEVQIVTLDVWKRTDSTVVPQVGKGQLAWLKSVLAQANADGVDWIIVQGHVPIAGPVRSRSSSNIMYQGGTGSALWKVLSNAKVDLYLCGEMHDTTAITPADQGATTGPVQITHGGLFYKGQYSYMIGSISGSQITLTTRGFTGSVSTDHGSMWETNRWWHQPNAVYYTGPSFVTGSLTLSKDGVVTNRTGALRTYTP